MLEVAIDSLTFRSSDGGDLQAIGDLQFRCNEKSFTSIVGPSGCGKTTTLRCIMGLEQDYRGEIRIDGSADLASGREKIATVFQEPRLLPWRTVEQNVKLALQRAVGDAQLTELFNELGLTEHRQFFPGELSLGLARRVSLARAFAVQPELLILDEPFVSLDDATAARLRNLLNRVWSARTCTALMVTHNLEEAIELSDRILFFSQAPTRVVLDYPITVPREQRDQATITAIRQSVTAALNGTAAD